MKINLAGLNLIKSFESCRLEAYPDPASGGEPWTIGYGATGSDINENTIWTQAQADARLAQDLTEFEQDVDKFLLTIVNQNEFSALVSFAYNVGPGNLKYSHLMAYTNMGDMAQAADEFLKWDRAGGVVVPGLTRRRQAERSLFLTSSPPTDQNQAV